MERSPSDRTKRSTVTRAGDGLRTRPALVSGPTVLAGRHDGGNQTSAARVRDDTALGVASAAGPGPNRRYSKGGGAVPDRLRSRLAAVTQRAGQTVHRQQDAALH